MLKRDKIALEISFFLLVGIMALIAMILLEGTPTSISRYASHESTVIIFKIWLLSIALGTYRSSIIKGAHIPAILIAVFDVSDVNALANILHNLSATAFIIAIILSIYKHDKKVSAAVLVSVLLYPIVGLYIGEIITMLIIYIYFIHNSLKLIR